MSHPLMKLQCWCSNIGVYGARWTMLQCLGNLFTKNNQQRHTKFRQKFNSLCHQQFAHFCDSFMLASWDFWDSFMLATWCMEWAKHRWYRGDLHLHAQLTLSCIMPMEGQSQVCTEAIGPKSHIATQLHGWWGCFGTIYLQTTQWRKELWPQT